MSLHRGAPAPFAAGLLALALAAPAQSPAAEASPTPSPASPGVARQGAPPAGLVVVEGVVQSVDLVAHRLTIEVDGSPLTLSLDRNTLVYRPTGLSTVFLLRPGELVRAGRSEALVAYWVELLPGEGRGAGPGGATSPETERNGPTSTPSP